MYDFNSRTKPHLVVGTFGPRGHGKTTLTSAITKELARSGLANALEICDIDKSKDERARGMTIEYNAVEYTTDKCHYVHLDCPGDAKYTDNLATALAQIDVGILVVSLGQYNEVAADVRTQLYLARQARVSDMVVFLNKADKISDDEEMRDLIFSDELFNIQRVLRDLRLDGGERTVFLSGSAFRAAEGDSASVQDVVKLLEVLDGFAGKKDWDIHKPFRMQIGNVFSITNVGTVASGRVAAGTIKPGDEVQVVGLRDTITTKVKEVHAFKAILDEARAGDYVGLLLEDVTRNNVSRGQTVASVGSQGAYKEFEMEMYLLGEKNGGRHTGFHSGFTPKFYIGTAEIAGEVTLPEDVSEAYPDSNIKASVKLAAPLAAVREGTRFAVRDNGVTVGVGIIVKVIG